MSRHRADHVTVEGYESPIRRRGYVPDWVDDSDLPWYNAMRARVYRATQFWGMVLPSNWKVDKSRLPASNRINRQDIVTIYEGIVERLVDQLTQAEDLLEERSAQLTSERHTGEYREQHIRDYAALLEAEQRRSNALSWSLENAHQRSEDDRFRGPEWEGMGG